MGVEIGLPTESKAKDARGLERRFIALCKRSWLSSHTGQRQDQGFLCPLGLYVHCVRSPLPP